MTLQTSGQIAISDISVEIGQPATYSTNLNFLNNLITPGQSSGVGTGGTGVATPSQRPATPNMTAFYGLKYYQSTNNGNCANGNCPNNCNCGNIGGDNCFINGGVNCTNCDTQTWLQSGSNCNCTYNCTYTNSASHNCNCACDCSKIICAKLYEQGYMAPSIWAADQKYGRYLRRTDKRVYQGYIKWARIVTAWMDGKGPTFMPWIKDETERNLRQKAAITDMALKIGTPWSEHMAYLMGALKQDNTMGRILMNIGRPICRLISFIPKAGAAKRRHSLPVVWTMWALFYFSYFIARGCVTLLNAVETRKQLQEVQK